MTPRFPLFTITKKIGMRLALCVLASWIAGCAPRFLEAPRKRDDSGYESPQCPGFVQEFSLFAEQVVKDDADLVGLVESVRKLTTRNSIPCWKSQRVVINVANGTADFLHSDRAQETLRELGVDSVWISVTPNHDSWPKPKLPPGVEGVVLNTSKLSILEVHRYVESAKYFSVPLAVSVPLGLLSTMKDVDAPKFYHLTKFWAPSEQIYGTYESPFVSFRDDPEKLWNFLTTQQGVGSPIPTRDLALISGNVTLVWHWNNVGRLAPTTLNALLKAKSALQFSK